MPRWKSRAIAGNATIVTDPSTNTAPEPRMVPTSIQRAARIRGFYTAGVTVILRTRPGKRLVGSAHAAVAEKYHSIHQGLRDVADLLHDRIIRVERVVTRRVRLVIADVTVDAAGAAGLNQLHVEEPVRERAAQYVCAGRVAMHEDRKRATGEMARVVPAVELQLLRQLGGFSARRCWIRIAAVGTDEAIHHQLQRARRLVPVHRRDDHDAMRGNPAWIDLVHPVVHLPHGVIGITRAWPVAQRHRGRDARF